MWMSWTCVRECEISAVSKTWKNCHLPIFYRFKSISQAEKSIEIDFKNYRFSASLHKMVWRYQGVISDRKKIKDVKNIPNRKIGEKT